MRKEDVERANILIEKINKIEKIINKSGYKEWSEEEFEMKIVALCDDEYMPVKLSKKCSDIIIKALKEEKKELEKELENL